MRTILISILLFAGMYSYGQKRMNPVIKSTGGIFEIPAAIELPNPSLDYKVVIDMATADSDPSKMAFSVNNLARMLNLHAVGGISNMTTVGVIHSTSTRSILTHEAYKKRYGIDNPNLEVIEELAASGVTLFVCGQSLIARGIDEEEVVDDVGIAVSALTVLTTYQLKGFANLRF